MTSDSNNSTSPAGRRFLVTGASGAIGKAVCDRLLADGATVIATDLAKESLPEETEGLTSNSLDVTDAESWNTVMSTILSSGSIDGAVFCHGIGQPRVPIHELPVDSWRQILDANLTGCFLGLQAVVPHLVERGWGRMVALASISAKEASAYEAAYAASKAGLVALIASTARDLATSGVTANSIAPGPVATELFFDQGEEHVADRMRRTPMGRAAEPSEVAALVSWLMSDESSYSTAQCFDLSGGRATY